VFSGSVLVSVVSRVLFDFIRVHFYVVLRVFLGVFDIVSCRVLGGFFWFFLSFVAPPSPLVTMVVMLLGNVSW